MNKFILFTVLIFIFTSCDPVSDMEATIQNLTSQEITIDFISSNDDFSKTLRISPNEMVLFQEGFDVGGSFLEPSLIEYDSVVIKNQLDMILKIYKENDSGKNIFNTDKYWKASEPSNRVYKYEYIIERVDID
ncbi:MAG: hypothetical protein RLN90_05880 [Balneolaceae bacterium]